MRVEIIIQPGERLSRIRRLRRRQAALILAVAVATLAPAAAFASHLFTDVPDGHTFHGNIANLANAGITNGCTPTTYCPDASVTRGQMAAFLNRGLGRIAEKDFIVSKVGNDSDVLASLTIKPGISPSAIAGANQFVRAEVSGTVQFTDLTGCPCQMGVAIRVNGAPASTYATGVYGANAGYIPYTATGVAELEGAVNATVEVYAYAITSFGATTAAAVYGNLTAAIFPFGSGGNDILGSAAPANAGSDPLLSQNAK